MSIQSEAALAQQYYIKTMKTSNGVVIAELTPDNVAKVEAMIRTDSSYSKAYDKKAKPKGKYSGSSAFWLTQLIAFINSKPVSYSFDEIIENAVKAIDRENSTHINADGNGRNEITKRIINFGQNQLVNCLKNRKYDLYDEISRKTTKGTKQRENKSFASKFCHYASFYLFENMKEQDNYPIYDGVLKENLQLYLDHHKVGGSYNLTDYKEYMDAIDALINKLGNTISRNGLDHLIWYYHKGR